MTLQNLIEDVERLIASKENLLEKYINEINVASVPERFFLDASIEMLKVNIQELNTMLSNLKNIN